jgi:hypothetical protein
MSDWQRAELARFDAASDDMRAGEAIWPAPKCPGCCETEVEYTDDICEECAEEDET